MLSHPSSGRVPLRGSRFTGRPTSGVTTSSWLVLEVF